MKNSANQLGLTATIEIVNAIVVFRCSQKLGVDSI